MATGQSKIFLDIEARLRGNEDIQKLNETIDQTAKASGNANDALVAAAKTLGLIPADRAQKRIDTLTNSFEALAKSGVLSAQEVEAAYQKTFATINRVGGAGAGEKFAAGQGRVTPAQVKADAEALAAVEAAVQQRAADRRVQIEQAANDRVLAIRERFDAVIASKSPEFQAGVRRDALNGVNQAPIRASTKALQEHDAQLAKTGATARQTAAALRILPAQFSDIVVSLQAGQNPLQVFLQQGAQIKDSFGGVGNAVREVGKALLAMVNPYTVAAAAAASYAAILYTAQKEQEALTRSIIFSGNAIGLSTGQLANTAQTVANATNSTVGTVNELVAALAQSGKIGADNLALITEAAVRLEKVGGMSIKETTALMMSLAKDPQKGLLELADKHGIVSLAIAEQVKRLIELGREEEAIALAQKFAADEFVKRAKIVEDSSGSLIKTFREVKKFAVDMWNSIFDLGRTDSDFQLKATEARIARLTELMKESDKQLLGGPAAKLYANQIAVEQKNLEVIKQKIAARDQETKAEGEATRAAKAAAEANDLVNKTIADGTDKQVKLNKALAEYRINVERVQAQRKKEGLAPLTAAQIAQGEAALRNKTLGVTAPTVNTFRVESIEGKKELAELQFQATERKRLYDQNLVDLDTYYKGQVALLTAQAELEQKNFDEQKKRLEGEVKKFGADPEKQRQAKAEIAKLDLESFKFQGDQVAKIKALEDERLKTVRAFRAEIDAINKSYLDITGQGTSAEAVEIRRLEIAQRYAAIEDKINTALSQRNVINGDELQRRKDQIAVIREQELALQNLAAAQKQLAVDQTGNSVEQIQVQSQLQQGLISQVEATERLNALKREQLAAQIAITEQAIAAGNLQGEALSQTTIKLAEMKAALEQVTPTVQAFGDQFKVLFQDRIAGALGDVLTRTKSFKEAFKSLLAGIVQDIIRSNITKLIGQIFGGALGGVSGAAGAGGTGGVNGSAGSGLGTVTAATGGYITGPGTGTSDSIPARLSNGEYVIKASSVQKFGKDFFDSLNAGQMSKFAKGGMVNRKPSVPQGFANGGMVAGAQDVTVNVINNSSQPVRARQDQDPRTGVIQVILEDLQRGGPISRGINGVTGTGRAVAR